MNSRFRPLIPFALAGCLMMASPVIVPAHADATAATAVQSVEDARRDLRAAKSLADYAAVRQNLLKAAEQQNDSAALQYWLGETTRRAARFAAARDTPEAVLAKLDLMVLDADEAIRRYSLALARDPKLAAAYFGRGSFYLDRNSPADNARALDDFNHAIALDPKLAQAYLGRALVLGRDSAPAADKILADYNKVLTLGIPADGEDEVYEKVVAPRLKSVAYAGRGAIEQQQGLADKALADYNQAITADPANLDIRVRRAGLLKDKNQTEKALADLNFVLEKQPDNAEALALRADLNLKTGQNEKARADMRRALQLDNKIVPQSPVYAGLSASLEAQKRGDEWLAQNAQDEALAEYGRALELDKENAAAMAGRATVRMRRGDLPGANADLDAALKFQPDSARLLTTRGQVLARQGKYDLALADLTRATDLAPENVAAWEQTGIVQQAQGNYAQAEKSYIKAITISALTEGVAGGPPSFAAIRRLIVRAAQEQPMDWAQEVKKLPAQQAAVGAQIVVIELRKHPDSKELPKLAVALGLFRVGENVGF